MCVPLCVCVSCDSHPGVHEAMLSLRYLEKYYSKESELPLGARARANADLVGIVFCNGFGGRSMDWAKLPMTHFEEAIANNLDYVICSAHKTSHHYGDLAKWLAPGTMAAMQCYCSLPRRPGVTTFFHPVGAETAEVNIPGALLNFCKTYLPPPPAFTRPGVNLLRKWFHTHLMSLTETEDKLLDVMKRIDAHSKDVAKRHYCLRDPQQDAHLAHLLVLAVLGQPVPWPGQDELDDARVQAQSRLPDAVDEPEAEEEGEDVQLEYFPWAECFGIEEPFAALQDDTSASTCLTLAPLTLPTSDEPKNTETNNIGTVSAKRCKVASDKGTSASTAVFVTDDPLRAMPSKQLQMEDVAVMTPAPPSALLGVTERLPKEKSLKQLALHDVAVSTAAPPSAPSGAASNDRKHRQLTMLDLTRAASKDPVTPTECAQRKKAHHYSAAEVAWVLSEHETEQGPNHIRGVARKAWFDDLFTKGTGSHVLSPAGSSSGIRSIVQRHVEKIRAEETRQAALQKRREDYRLKHPKLEGEPDSKGS